MNPSQEFQEFYRAEFRSLWGFAYLLTGDWNEAEELAQDAMVRTCHAWSRIRDRERPQHYARAVLLNLQRSLFRRAKKARAIAPRLVASATVDEPDVDQVGLWKALQSCSLRQRQALVLRFCEDRSEAEVAQILECPVGTVKSLVHRGLERAREHLGADGELTPTGGDIR